MIRFTYPKSFLSLLLIGFSIVAAPLVFALFTNVMAFEKLAALSEQAVHSAVRVTEASRSLLPVITSLERSARQYAVAGDSTFLEAYRTNRSGFVALMRGLDAMALSEDQRSEVAAIIRDEASINALITQMGPVPELSRRLPAQFALLVERGQKPVRLGDQVDEGIEQLRTQAVQSRNSVFWLMIVLIPTAIALTGSFTYLISRPITQVSAGIRALGEASSPSPSDRGPGRHGAPGSAARLATRALGDAGSAEDALPAAHLARAEDPTHRASRGSDLLPRAWWENLNAEQRESRASAGELDRAEEAGSRACSTAAPCTRRPPT
jgi:two-component system sensor histidine kinase GlrK